MYNTFKPSFSTKETWNHIRALSPTVHWHHGVWFKHATPKYSFCTWLAVRDRLSTGDHMLKWNRGVSGHCVFCTNTIESRNHLFFSCNLVSEIWTAAAKKIWRSDFSTGWSQILAHISDKSLPRVEGFLMRYVFQVTVYTIWKERNRRRHGEASNTSTQLISWIDKQVRNQLTIIQREGDRRYERGMETWFKARS